MNIRDPRPSEEGAIERLLFSLLGALRRFGAWCFGL